MNITSSEDSDLSNIRLSAWPLNLTDAHCFIPEALSLISRLNEATSSLLVQVLDQLDTRGQLLLTDCYFIVTEIPGRSLGFPLNVNQLKQLSGWRVTKRRIMFEYQQCTR